MIEQMLNPGVLLPEDTGDVIFLYDPVTNTDLIGGPAVSTLSGGAIADSTILINNQPTLKFPTTNAKHVITWPTDLNLAIGNWTLEWSFINDSTPAAYGNDLVMYSRSGGSGVGVYMRFGNTGFGNRYFMSDPRGAVDQTLTQPLPIANSSLTGVTTNIALVSIQGVIRIYVNGVAQMMALGVSTNTYDRPSMIAQGMDKIYSIGLGWAVSAVPAVPGHRGRIRLSNFARYRRSYTPGPLV